LSVLIYIVYLKKFDFFKKNLRKTPTKKPLNTQKKEKKLEGKKTLTNPGPHPD